MSNGTFQVFSGMSFLTLEQLPFVGMSYEFVGEKQGAPFSAYIVAAEPGQGPPLHTHPYVEVAFTLEGCASITAASSSFPRTHRIDSLIPATRRCAKSTSTRARDLSKRISPEGFDSFSRGNKVILE
jgi:hypothetical protein